MIGVIDWAASRVRMVFAFIILSLMAGALAYVNLPKEGAPDIEIPAIFISVPYPGISAQDSEKLLVKVIESELSDLDGLDTMSSTAAENYAGITLEFDFGWDKAKTLADVRDAMNAAESKLPEDVEKYSINELNLSELPIIVVNLSGDVPDRTMYRLAKDLQNKLEDLEPVLEAGIAGMREEMIEVVIDPLKLEAYDITAPELINAVRNNNRLIAAGEVDNAQGTFSVVIPSSLKDQRDIYSLPVAVNDDRVVTVGNLATINFTFEDRRGTARFNGENSTSIQVVKRKGYNIIDTADLVSKTVEEAKKLWPPELKEAVDISTSNDQSRVISSMVGQLESSVVTAIALVMIVTLFALGIRPSLLVGFAIPTSFLLCFAFLSIMGVAISNIVMFGLILSVGMLVDGAIVIVDYADKRIQDGEGPMHAYISAAKRMFWPVVSSTATTLCVFLPMLLWPGMSGQFMRMLPVTMIFVLSAALLVALVYLPVMGGVTGRSERWIGLRTTQISNLHWILHLLLMIFSAGAAALAAIAMPSLLEGLSTGFQTIDAGSIFLSVIPTLVISFTLIVCLIAMAALGIAGGLAFLLGLMAVFQKLGNLRRYMISMAFPGRGERVSSGYRRSVFGWMINIIASNPIAPLVSCCAVFVFTGSVLLYFANNNHGVEFFVDTEPEDAIIYVKARGNSSLDQKDALVKQAEEIVLEHPNVLNVFTSVGESGLRDRGDGGRPPIDTIGSIQIEILKFEERPLISETWFTIPIINHEVKRTITDPEYSGKKTIRDLTQALERLPGLKTEIQMIERGPSSAKPLHLRIKGDNWEELTSFTRQVRQKFDDTYGLTLIEDTLPVEGIDWQIDIDVEKAGRYGADVASVGGMVQLVTRGILLDTVHLPTSDEEVEIRARLPEEDRVLSTLDTLKMRTAEGLIPLSNFVTRTPVSKLAQINRADQTRFFDVKAGIVEGLTVANTDRNGTETTVPLTANERTARITEWLESGVLPPNIEYEWTGDANQQGETTAFLQQAFLGALGLMFIILLAQFNSVYNSVLVMLSVVLSLTGVAVGMLVMEQPFSIIMTGTGIVALAGIVVNNNIVLIDTYQDFVRYLSQSEAITRSAEARIRPVLLTTITTIAGLTPMMLGITLDFANGGYSIDTPTALWWKQLSTAVIFGLALATVLTLIFTPSMLALRVWAGTYMEWISRILAWLSFGRGSSVGRDWALARSVHRARSLEIVWDGSLLKRHNPNKSEYAVAVGEPIRDDMMNINEASDTGIAEYPEQTSIKPREEN